MIGRASRVRAWIVGLALLAPAIEAARPPACCAGAPGSEAPRACCRPQTAPTAQPRGCCKTPEAERPQTATAAPAPIACAGIETATSAAAPRAHVEVPVLETLRAQWDHRAASPDDSPPDRLARHGSLLI